MQTRLPGSLLLLLLPVVQQRPAMQVRPTDRSGQLTLLSLSPALQFAPALSARLVSSQHSPAQPSPAQHGTRQRPLPIPRLPPSRTLARLGRPLLAKYSAPVLRRALAYRTTPRHQTLFTRRAAAPTALPISWSLRFWALRSSPDSGSQQLNSPRPAYPACHVMGHRAGR